MKQIIPSGFNPPTFSKPTELKDILEDWFATRSLLFSPATPNHLYTYLGMDWFQVLELQAKDPEYLKLFTTARMILELKIIERGFIDDKSFSKYYLDRYLPKEETKLTGGNTTVTITLDTTEPHKDVKRD